MAPQPAGRTAPGLWQGRCPTLPPGWRLAAMGPREGPCRGTPWPFVGIKIQVSLGSRSLWGDSDPGGAKVTHGVRQAPLLALSWLCPETEALAPLGARGLRDGKGKVDSGVVYGAHGRRKGQGFEVRVWAGRWPPRARAFAHTMPGPGDRTCCPRACVLVPETKS